MLSLKGSPYTIQPPTASFRIRRDSRLEAVAAWFGQLCFIRKDLMTYWECQGMTNPSDRVGAPLVTNQNDQDTVARLVGKYG
jgi:hypothetical protein